MTLRLYHADSYLQEFSALVLERQSTGEGLAVLLDRTAFYPSSGGQPSDTGSLGDARVLRVEENPSGAVLHFVDADIPPGPATGRIDWQRRFDHMQQHSGQHILSQAFLQVARAQTVSFHLGEEISTIDLEPAAAADIVREAEQLSCRMVFEDRPVTVRDVAKEEQSALGVRKASDREGAIRIVEVEGFDRSPCGGTHVRRTGEIGLIAVLGSERYKGGTRVEFVCGERALTAFRREHGLLHEAARLCSAHPSDVPQLVEKLFQEKASLSRENTRLQDHILKMEAEDLLVHADKMGEASLVRKIFADRKIENIKSLAHKLTSGRGIVALLAVGGETPQAVVARSPDIAIACNQAVKDAIARWGGKGGGRPELAQAGGMPAAVLDRWLDAIESCFRSVLHS